MRQRPTAHVCARFVTLATHVKLQPVACLHYCSSLCLDKDVEMAPDVAAKCSDDSELI